MERCSNMTLRYLIGIIAIIGGLSFPSHAQPYIVQGSIEHSGQGRIYLASYYGDSFRIVDSLEATSGSFLFLLSEEDQTGVYRLIYSDEYEGVRNENRFVEFIYNQNDVLLNVSGDEKGPLPSFENSIENQVYLEFIAFQLEYEVLLSEAYLSAANRYEDLQHSRIRFIDSLTQKYPDLYATRILNAFRTPVVPGSLSHRDRIAFLKLHFFDAAPLDDPELLYAPVYSFRTIDYLSLYAVDTLSRKQMELRFMEAVDRILVNTSSVPELRSFVVEFLLEGFELLGLEQVQLHLADNYLDEACEFEVAELVRARMEGYKRMKVGATAPDFTFRDIQGKNHTLSQLPGTYTLVMFWASTCGHCREMIP
jgi:hypothetical protein